MSTTCTGASAAPMAPLALATLGGSAPPTSCKSAAHATSTPYSAIAVCHRCRVKRRLQLRRLGACLCAGAHAATSCCVMACSASSQILRIVATVSTGKSPIADSPLSITASVPSSTAFATSQASARVGKGLSSMDASISVAVTTNLPAALVFLIIIFCAIQIFSMGISIPKSPRATIMPSDSSRISSKFLRPSTFSILEMILICLLAPAQCFRHSATSSRLCTKLRAM
mmetsp:Transcript_7613/g.18859  ORF Transcript_7613/g.18859 Transcript_7613/m.18859 type:complete len:228 (+) Transcript_7613:128-811(+)